MMQLSPLREKLYRIVMLLVMSPLFLGCFFLDQWTYIQYRLSYYGQDYPGEVIDKEMNSRKRRTTYYMVYSYRADGQRRTGSEGISGDTYKNLVVLSNNTPGEKVYVRVLRVGDSYYSTAGFSQF